MKKKKEHITFFISQRNIEEKILFIRSKKVMIDSDLAMLYGVTTKRLNEQVKRNKERFPEDFMFQLTEKEKQEVVANCDHLEKLKFSPQRPNVFTEYGVLMLANVIKSNVAIEMSILIVRAFVRLREMLITHKGLQRKIEVMEKKYDRQFKVIFDAIKQLLSFPEKPKRKIGFHSG